MKVLPLSNGGYTLVDDDIYESVKEHPWHDNGYGYVYRTEYLGNYQRSKIALHHVVIGKPPKGFDTDHIDGNSLNNTRLNLRFVNRRINCLNSTKRTCIQKYGSTWRFRYTQDNGVRVRVSGFKTREEAESVARLLKGALIYHELTKGVPCGIG